MSLLTSRRLLPLLVTQALGAINDNMFKTALSVLVLFKAAGSGGAELVALANGVFILPYMLFSATAGQLADRWEKSRAVLAVKGFEVALMLLAAAALLLGSTLLLFLVLFGLGVQATFFGPLKYALIPSHLRESELVAGNGLVEAGTFLGILAGTIAGSALVGSDHGAMVVSALGLAVAVAGVASAAFVPRAPSNAPTLPIGWNVWRETAALLTVARRNRPVWLSLLGLSWFWVLGATLVAELPSLVKVELGAQPPVFTLLLVFFSVGVGVGSVGCSRLLRGEVSARLVPFAALGLTLFLWDFARAAAAAGPLPTMAAVLGSFAGWRLLIDLMALAASGGLFSVPLYAILQDQSAPSHRARMVAANNVVNAVAVVVGAVVVAGLAAAQWQAPAILLLAAGLNGLVAAWTVRLRPSWLSAGPAFRGRLGRRVAGEALPAGLPPSGHPGGMAERSVFAALLAAQARFGAGTKVLEDSARQPLSYRRVVQGAVVLGRRLAQEAEPEEAVGVMLPNSNGAMVTFMALQAFGRLPAMLNYAAGAETMLAACAVARVRTVLCSRAFVERGKLGPVVARMEPVVRFVWLEDVRRGLGLAAKLRGAVEALWASRLPGARVAADAAAVILFTSGSEGMPKGVVLSHRNLLANIAQVASVVDFTSADRVFNAMPVFHALGLTGAALLPLLCGVRTFHYPSPLHYRVIPELIYDTGSTIAFGSDTFLTGWARAAHPHDFRAVQMIFTGAERLREETRRVYAERFGVRLLEGYGLTETAPVVALNTPTHDRPGTVGRFLPGISYRLEPVEGIAEGGRLFVSGPNVMRGYLLGPGGTAAAVAPPQDGWHDTGDICQVDADGFMTLVARAKRFAKIAGEMVSMPAAELLAHALWPDAMHAVVARLDGRKGEALVLLTTEPGATASALLAHARARGVTDLAVPRIVQRVEALPLLPTGKTDYAAATRLAAAAERA